MTLSSLIVQREVATMRQVEEALARQVIYGGDLATNLLEVAPVDEGVLTQLVAETMNLAPAPPGQLPVAPEPVRALVPPEIAAERGLVPLALDGEILVIAVAERLPAELEERLMFTLGIPIEQRAASAVRVRQAISLGYGLPLDRRMQRLVARLSGNPWPNESQPPPLAASRPPAPPPRQVTTTPAARWGTTTPPLGSPVATIARNASVPRSLAPSMPARRHTARSFPATAPPPPPTSAPSGSTPFASAPFSSTPFVSTPYPSVRSASVPSASAPPAESVKFGTTPPPVTSPSPERRAGLLQRDAPSSVRSSRRRLGPITFEAAEGEADEASDRNTLLDLFFDFSRQFFDYAVLFLIHGDIAEGRDAFGTGVSRERVVGIGVPLDIPSLVSRARDERAPIVAGAPANGLDAVLLADLQRPHDIEIAIVPLVVRTRAVAILLGDCGDAGIDKSGVHRVTTFAAIVGKALERIIVRRKLESLVAVAKAGDSPSIDGPGVSVRPLASTMPPPPPNVVTVRKFTSPPIPREEPETPSRVQIATPPSPGVDDTRIVLGIPQALDSRALFDMLGWETGAEEPEVAPPSSSLAVAPHRPPIAHMTPPEELPSVIVNLEHELAAMVDRVVDGDLDESAEGELLRQGERAMGVIMSRFPGPLTYERARIASTLNPPRASECGPLLRLIARERKVALPFVLRRLSDPDPHMRGWATHLLGELTYVEAIPHALAQLRDPDDSTRASAVHAVTAIAAALPDSMRDAIKTLGSAVDVADRTAAMLAMAQLRQPALVPDLVAGLADLDWRVIAAAHDALVLVTAQDFGTDARSWMKWWEESSSRHRIEWLIDALTHDIMEIRRVAGEELRAITREYFGYSADLPPRDRNRAQQRYRDWWITEGRTRFRRSHKP
jgi:hypothetical protein